MREKPVGGKGRTVPSRYSKARTDAGAMKEFGDYLRAKDVSGKGRSAAAGRRQGELKKAATKITASKMGGYAPSASSASPTSKKKVSNAAQATEAKRAAAARSRAKARKTIPNTK